MSPSNGWRISYMIRIASYHIKTLREDAYSAQGEMVAEATAPRCENVHRHILFSTQIYHISHLTFLINVIKLENVVLRMM